MFQFQNEWDKIKELIDNKTTQALPKCSSLSQNIEHKIDKDSFTIVLKLHTDNREALKNLSDVSGFKRFFANIHKKLELVSFNLNEPRSMLKVNGDNPKDDTTILTNVCYTAVYTLKKYDTEFDRIDWDEKNPLHIIGQAYFINSKGISQPLVKYTIERCDYSSATLDIKFTENDVQLLRIMESRLDHPMLSKQNIIFQLKQKAIRIAKSRFLPIAQ